MVGRLLKRIPLTPFQFGWGINLHREPNVQSRMVVPELMDDAQLPQRLHEQALAGLARLNRWSRSSAGLWTFLRKEARHIAPRPLRILDIATGSGDIPIQLLLRARSANVSLSVSACDINSTALETARRQAAKHDVALKLYQSDVVKDPIPPGYDVVLSSLFLHHLAEPQATKLLRSMADAASRLVIVNDLQRSRMNLSLVTMASRILSRSPVVHFDAPASVRAAFTRDEAKHLATQAGLIDAEVVSYIPCRWLLTWRKPA